MKGEVEKNPPPHPLFPNQYGGEFQDGGEFTIASSKTPALQASVGMNHCAGKIIGSITSRCSGKEPALPDTSERRKSSLARSPLWANDIMAQSTDKFAFYNMSI